MIVSLKAFKQELKRAKVALSTGALDGADGHIQLKFRAGCVRVGGHGVSLSYAGTVEGQGQMYGAIVYISKEAAGHLSSPNTKEDKLVLELVGNDLHFEAGHSQGIIKTHQGMPYWAPYATSDGAPYVLLQDSDILATALKTVVQVKSGWTTKTRPYPARFVRLVVQEEDQELDACRLLLSTVTSEQDSLVNYATGTALSVFASDEARYFQAFEPMYPLPTPDELVSGDFPRVSTVTDPAMIDKPIHLLLSNAEALSKVLPSETVRVHLLQDEQQRIKAMTFFSRTTFIWVGVSLYTYPDADFNAQLAYLNGMKVAAFTVTPSFKNAVKAACGVKETQDHGLTFRVEDGKILISSPEDGNSVRYGEVDADTFCTDPLTVVVDGNGVRVAILSMRDEITVVSGVGFIAFYNPTTASRIILRTYER